MVNRSIVHPRPVQRRAAHDQGAAHADLRPSGSSSGAGASPRRGGEALERYQTKTKVAPLSPNSEAGVSASAELLARKFEVEIALRMKQSVLRENNEEIRLLRAELAEIDRKLAICRRSDSSTRA